MLLLDVIVKVISVKCLSSVVLRPRLYISIYIVRKIAVLFPSCLFISFYSLFSFTYLFSLLPVARVGHSLCPIIHFLSFSCSILYVIICTQVNSFDYCLNSKVSRISFGIGIGMDHSYLLSVRLFFVILHELRVLIC
jgi:hypothetical protein